MRSEDDQMGKEVASARLKDVMKNSGYYLGIVRNTPDEKIYVEPGENQTNLKEAFQNAAFYLRLADDVSGDGRLWRRIAEKTKKDVAEKVNARFLLSIYYLRETRKLENDFSSALNLDNPSNVPWAMEAVKNYFQSVDVGLDNSWALGYCADLFGISFEGVELMNSRLGDDVVPESTYISVRQIKELKTYIDGYLDRKTDGGSEMSSGEVESIKDIRRFFSNLETNQQKTDLVQD